MQPRPDQPQSISDHVLTILAANTSNYIWQEFGGRTVTVMTQQGDFLLDSRGPGILDDLVINGYIALIECCTYRLTGAGRDRSLRLSSLRQI
jgi:hypothetical protein